LKSKEPNARLQSGKQDLKIAAAAEEKLNLINENITLIRLITHIYTKTLLTLIKLIKNIIICGIRPKTATFSPSKRSGSATQE
jgi:hypothetical protein